jgi:Uma2 family endonuclease
MAAGTLVSVEEYLRTSYRPDCDYVDGEVLGRNLGERKHSRAQREILYFLRDRYSHLRERIYPEQRVQISATRFRIPDICVTAEGAPDEEIITFPPALCIEILSPEDTLSKTVERVKDFFHLGVPTCWIIDPVSCIGWAAIPGRLEEATDGILRADDIEMPLADVLE